jgi:DNA-binding transcriptional regulator YdaS (Cro superfamily)
MKLIDYLLETNTKKADFARAIKVPDALLYQWLNELRPVAPKHCPAIEAATGGKVTRKELRPDDWQDIWPDLVSGAPCSSPSQYDRRSTDKKASRKKKD